MKTTLTFKTLLAAGALMIGSLLQAHATPIVGSVAFENGNAVLNGPLATATAITSYQGTTIVNSNIFSTTGDYATTGGAVVTFTPFSFKPASTPVNPLWTFTSGADTYFFDLASLTIVTQNSGFLNISGNGTLFIQLTSNSSNVYTPTAGNFTFTIQTSSGNPQDTFEFTASNAALPDNGMTATLLGVAMAGVWFAKRQFAGLKA